jgi:hypothetical protein
MLRMAVWGRGTGASFSVVVMGLPRQGAGARSANRQQRYAGLQGVYDDIRSGVRKHQQPVRI